MVYTMGSNTPLPEPSILHLPLDRANDPHDPQPQCAAFAKYLVCKSSFLATALKNSRYNRVTSSCIGDIFLKSGRDHCIVKCYARASNI